ncbi:QacE family quaternary ammonium compound efflux SMR transporter [Chromobacterium sinusclupearum]|uniref:Spermidine export protein MdtJ n=1 Tax=Chromobacterium sinusclupearum TaxID=2077146 RepID=A0A2K4MMY2_9NEIS|nr:SMR family transporter [Chromobacterium sinusclupearum]POA98446.1 QacE family quaternary ammonium compound efflux SMR transporter [Chromobacterium sinusclupearum]
MHLRPWLFLLAAITVEVIGVTVMKRVADSGGWSALLFMYAMIGLSFFFLATAMESLPIASAYATWETIGLIAITFIGYRYFSEEVGLLKLLGMSILIAGVVLVNLSAKPAQE